MALMTDRYMDGDDDASAMPMDLSPRRTDPSTDPDSFDNDRLKPIDLSSRPTEEKAHAQRQLANNQSREYGNSFHQSETQTDHPGLLLHRKEASDSRSNYFVERLTPSLPQMNLNRIAIPVYQNINVSPRELYPQMRRLGAGLGHSGHSDSMYEMALFNVHKESHGEKQCDEQNLLHVRPGSVDSGIGGGISDTDIELRTPSPNSEKARVVYHERSNKQISILTRNYQKCSEAAISPASLLTDDEMAEMNPIVKKVRRRRGVPVPDERKDEAYREKRRKNNGAARVCRWKRNEKMTSVQSANAKLWARKMILEKRKEGLEKKLHRLDNAYDVLYAKYQCLNNQLTFEDTDSQYGSLEPLIRHFNADLVFRKHF